MQELLNNLQLNDYVQMISTFLGAFFAFCFFILGQLWISSSQKRKKMIAELERLREYMVMQIYFFETNIQKYKKITDVATPIGIFVDELNFFSVEEYVYQRISRFRVAESIIKFIVHLRILNEDIRVFNKWANELSEFSRVAMLERREQEFSETMENNVEKFKRETKKIYDHMISTKAKIDRLLAEIDFTEYCIRLFFWTKLYMNLRMCLDSTYRDKQIAKIQDKKAKNKTMQKEVEIQKEIAKT